MEYQTRIEEAVKKSVRQKDATMEELKKKLDLMAQRSGQEIKDFILDSQVRNQSLSQRLTSLIKEKLLKIS